MYVYIYIPATKYRYAPCIYVLVQQLHLPSSRRPSGGAAAQLLSQPKAEADPTAREAEGLGTARPLVNKWLTLGSS